MKRTPLYAAHQKLGARLIEFGGWEMPVQYTSIMDEHHAVRTAAGIFDISHMGEVSVSGPGAVEFLNSVLTNDARKLQAGQGQYTLLCNEHGGVIDDLYAYRLGDEDFMLIINASRIEADVEWLERQLTRTDVRMRNRSDELGAVAVQGPKVAEFIGGCFPACVTLRKNEITQVEFSGKPILVSRTGYTGEDGFEIVA